MYEALDWCRNCFVGGIVCLYSLCVCCRFRTKSIGVGILFFCVIGGECVRRVPELECKWWQNLRLGRSIAHAPGASMTPVYKWDFGRCCSVQESLSEACTSIWPQLLLRNRPYKVKVRTSKQKHTSNFSDFVLLILFPF